MSHQLLRSIASLIRQTRGAGDQTPIPGFKTNGLTLCILGNFSCFFVACCFFSKSTFWKNSFMSTIRVSNSLDLDQARHFVGPDLGPNCLQKLSADDIRRQKVNHYTRSAPLLCDQYPNLMNWLIHIFRL